MLKKLKDLKTRIFGAKSEADGIEEGVSVLAYGNQDEDGIDSASDVADRGGYALEGSEEKAPVDYAGIEEAADSAKIQTPCEISLEEEVSRCAEEEGVSDVPAEAEKPENSDGRDKLKDDADEVRRAVGRKNKIPRKELVTKTGKSEVVRANKETSTLRKISAIWTLVSTAYAIVTTCLFVSRDWVSSTVSYVLIAILAVYIAAFVGLIVYVVRDPKKGTKSTKTYKKVLGIFKAFINVVFLALTAVSLTGMAANDMSVGKWIMFVLTFVVAVVQLGLKICLLVMKLVTKHIAKKYKVKIENYRDGSKKKNGAMDKLTERRYREKD